MYIYFHFELLYFKKYEIKKQMIYILQEKKKNVYLTGNIKKTKTKKEFYKDYFKTIFYKDQK